MDHAEFLRLLRAQLAEDRETDTDSRPLYLSGPALRLIGANGYGLMYLVTWSN